MNFSRIRINPVHAALTLVAVALAVVAVETVTARHGTPTPAVSVPATSGGPAGVAAETPTPDGHSTPAPTAPSQVPAVVDDGAGPAPTPTVTADPRLVAAQAVAERFAGAWMNTTNKTPEQWRADLAGYITSELANELATADPTTVPVGQLGQSTIAGGVDAGPGDVLPLVLVKIPVTTGGTLTLSVIAGDHPLVSDVDWAAKS